MNRDIYAEVDYDLCVEETANAVCLKIEDVDYWVPRSLLDPDEDSPSYNAGSAFIARWFAQKEGLI